MKKVFNIFIALIFILILGSCNESDEKIVPIFEGLSLINNDNIKKVTNKNLNVREETDYSELIPIDIVNSNVTYFTKAGSEVRIAVNLYNPSQFEIMSLTINDLKYQSYQFEDGSNSDILYIDVLAPNNPGEYEYNIDEIKYVDGKDIKDVNMENGNKQIKFGVTYEKLPIVNISNQNITNNSINLDIQVSDNLNVLNAGNGLNAYLFNEDNMIIASTKLENNKIMFNNLKEGTYYTYVLATSVDMLDGMGAGTYILLQEKFRTTSTIDFKDIVATKNEISYDVIIKNENSYINSINLIDGEKIVDITNTRIIKDLLSDHNYILELNYKYGDYEYKIREDVKTLENVKPIIKAFNVETNKNSINYNYEIEDIDNVIINKEIILSKDDITIKINDDKLNQFNDLLSNTNYKITLRIYYDLLDGNGIKVFEESKEIKTKPLMKPEIGISYSLVDDLFIGKLNIVDVDNTFIDVRYELRDNGGNLIQTMTDISEIKGLKRNANYSLNAIYSYYLLDGKGVIEDTYILEFVTSKQVPTIKLSPYNITNDSIGMDIIETDPNLVGEVEYVRIFNENGEYLNQILGVNTFSFNDLLPNTYYIIKVYYNYDLDDGNGTTEHILEEKVKTAKFLPEVDFDVDSTKESVQIKPNIKDIHNAGEISNIKLLMNNEVIKEGKELLFNNLLSNNDYIIELIYSYDLEDLNGNKELVIQKEFKTIAKEIPTIKFNIKNVTYNSISLKYELIDNDNIFNYEKGILYLNDKEYKESSFDNLIITDLYSDNLYTFICTYSYDLNDGLGKQYAESSIDIETPKYDISLSYDSNKLKSSENTIYFDYKEIDPTNTINIIEIKILDNLGEVIQKLEDLSVREFTNLTNASFYTIVTTYTYDELNGEGTKTNIIYQKYGTSGAKVNILGFEVINSDSLLVGEEAHIRVSIDNPNNLKLTALHINDNRYDIAQQTTDGNGIIIKFIPDTLGGIYNVTLSGYSYVVNSGHEEIELTENLFDKYESEIYVLGDLNITYFGSADGKPYYTNNDTLMIEFESDLQYNIDEISLKYNKSLYTEKEIIILKDEIEVINSYLIFKINWDTSIKINYIKYSINDSSTIKYFEKQPYLTYVIDKTPRNITKPNDFYTLENNYVYEITNDIDFSNYIIDQVNSFEGVILGNNHNIKNIGYSKTYKGEDTNYLYVGVLFNEFIGYIENLNITDPYVSLKSEYKGDIYFGLMAGEINYSQINNVNISNLQIESIGMTGIGGLLGYVRYSIINTINMSINNNSSCETSGVIYYLNNSIVEKIIVSGKIASEKAYCTGVVYTIDNSLVSEIINYATISTSGFSFGVYQQMDSGILKNVINYADTYFAFGIGYGGYLYNSICLSDWINYLPSNGTKVEGCVGNFIEISEYNCNNVYSTNSDYADADNLATKEMLSSKEFWLGLGYDETIWNLDNLDDGFPTLRFVSE